MYEDKAQEIVSQACKLLTQRKHTKVKAIYMTIGTASVYNKECLDIYLKKAAKGTQVENAKIIVKEIVARLRCPRCGKEYVRDPRDFKCPVCLTEGVPCEIGTQMQVDEIITE